MNREDFNKSMCSAFILSALGLPLLSTSCSKSEEIGETGEVDETLLADGIKREGNTLTISMEHSKYQELKTPGNFINDLENGVLVLRKDEESIIAVNNCVHTKEAVQDGNTSEKENSFAPITEIDSILARVILPLAILTELLEI